MPLYDYECNKCEYLFERFFPLKKYNTPAFCPSCGYEGRKVLTAQIQRDEPAWLDDSVRMALQDCEGGDRPIENRTQYKRYLKDNGLDER